MLPLCYSFEEAMHFFDQHPWDRCIVVRRKYIFWQVRAEVGSIGEMCKFYGIH